MDHSRVDLTTNSGATRRQVARGAAWAAPVMVAAAAAPAYAASTHPNTTVTSALGCKPKTGGDQSKDFYTTVCFRNADIHPVIITAESATLGGVPETIAGANPNPLSIPAGGTGCVTVHITSATAGDRDIAVYFQATDTVTGTQAPLVGQVPKADIGTC